MRNAQSLTITQRVPGRTGKIRYSWWRAHHGLPTHPKWRSVARAANVPVSVAFHIVVCLLDTASRGSPRGSVADFKPFDCAGIVDVDLASVERVIEVLKGIHWIEGHMIGEWDDRQPQREDDGAAKRAQEYRDRNRHAASRSVTHDHGDVTHASGDVTTANAPDREYNITTTFPVAARASPADGKRAAEGNKGQEPAIQISSELVQSIKGSKRA